MPVSLQVIVVDLLASIPTLRILRLFRIFKAYRLLKKYGGRNILSQLKKHKAESVLYIFIFFVMLVIESEAYFVLMAERSAPNTNIQSSSDAMWWVYVTIMTVGYGDRYPVTTAGRLIGVAVMTMGVGLFGTLAGFIANKLLAPDSTENNRQDRTGQRQALTSRRSEMPSTNRTGRTSSCSNRWTGLRMNSNAGHRKGNKSCCRSYAYETSAAARYWVISYISSVTQPRLPTTQLFFR